MHYKNTKTFSTGEFAKRFGVSKDTLLYYDKIKLFQPAGIKENGYRYYTMSQLDIFWAIHSLKELNLPLKELKTYIDSPSAKQLLAISEQKLIEVNKEMEKLQEIKWLLENIKERTKEASACVIDQIDIKELPEEIILCSEPISSTVDITQEMWSDIYDVFLDSIHIKGPAYVGSIIDYDNLIQGKFGLIANLFVRMNRDRSIIKPGGLYAINYIEGDFDTIVSSYHPLLQNLKSMGYEAVGNAYEEYLINELVMPSEKSFITKISIPVRGLGG